MSNPSQTLKQMSASEVESHSKRVTAEDIAQVTPEQIQAVLQTASREQMRAVMKTMVDTHRTGDVLSATSNSNFDASLQYVTTEQLAETALQMQTNPAFQAELLESMTDNHRVRCAEHLEQRQAARKSSRQQ